eukprot:g841.t1
MHCRNSALAWVCAAFAMGTVALLLALCAGFGASSSDASAAAPSFTIGSDRFLRDGEPMSIMSGELHYARIPRAYWRDRMQRLQAMGMNAVATYVPWNFHETTRGSFDFTGQRDLGAFLDTAKDLGLLVLLRAGPYMCGEWEFGGLPAWLLAIEPRVTIRTYEAGYIAAVDAWWKGQLLPRVKPHLYSQGGAVVMVQMENEFGSYGDVSKNPLDKQYMEHLVALANGVFGAGAVQLYTTDGGNAGYMTRGSLKGDAVYTVGDHGPGDDTGNCAAMATFNPAGANPCMDAEYYPGWLTHWGEAMANHTNAPGATYMDKMLVSNGSFSMYMAHGGTNWAFWAGANGGGQNYQPHITSYDYDAPVSEGGEHAWASDGDKYAAFRAVLARYSSAPLPVEPPLPPRGAYAPVSLTEAAPLLGAASLAALTTNHSAPGRVMRSMEQIGQNYGLMLYEATTPAAAAGVPLDIAVSPYPRDRAHVFVDGARATAAPLFRTDGAKAAPLDGGAASVHTAGGQALQLLVENLGRLNFGGGMTDHKGVDGSAGEAVLWAGANMSAGAAPVAWTARALPLEYEQIAKLPFSAGAGAGTEGGGQGGGAAPNAYLPTFYRGTLHVAGAPHDTWVLDAGWGKGVVWVNGHNVGRYWRAMGPQHALYVPAPWMRMGDNDVVVLEIDGQATGAAPTLQFGAGPDFSGKPAPACTGAAAGSVASMQRCSSALAGHQEWTLDSAGRIVLASTANYTAGSPASARAGASRGLGLGHGAAGGPLCLSVGPGTDATYGFPLAQLEPCSATDDAQKMAPTGSTGAASTIKDAAKGKCLDVSNHDKADGAPVGFYACVASDNQLWTVQDTPSHGVQLVVKETGNTSPRKPGAQAAASASSPRRKSTKARKKVKKRPSAAQALAAQPGLLELRTIYEGPVGRRGEKLFHKSTLIVTNRTIEIEREGAHWFGTLITFGLWYFMFQTATIEIYELDRIAAISLQDDTIICEAKGGKKLCHCRPKSFAIDLPKESDVSTHDLFFELKEAWQVVRHGVQAEGDGADALVALEAGGGQGLGGVK